MFCCEGRVYRVNESAFVSEATRTFQIKLSQFKTLTADRNHLWSLDSFVNSRFQSSIPSTGVGVIRTKSGAFVWYSKVVVDLPANEAKHNRTTQSPGSDFVWEWSPGKATRSWSSILHSEQIDGIFRPLAHTPPSVESLQCLLHPDTVDCDEVLWSELCSDDRWFLSHVHPLSTCLVAPCFEQDPYRDRNIDRVQKRRSQGPPIEVNSLFWTRNNWEKDKNVTRDQFWGSPSSTQVIKVSTKDCTSYSILPTMKKQTRGCNIDLLPFEVVDAVLNIVARRCMGMTQQARWSVSVATRLRCVCRDFRGILDDQLDRLRIEALHCAAEAVHGNGPSCKLPIRLGKVACVMSTKITWKTVYDETCCQCGEDQHSTESMHQHHECIPVAKHAIATETLHKRKEARRKIVDDILRVNSLATKCPFD